MCNLFLFPFNPVKIYMPKFTVATASDTVQVQKLMSAIQNKLCLFIFLYTQIVLYRFLNFLNPKIIYTTELHVYTEFLPFLSFITKLHCT